MREVIDENLMNQMASKAIHIFFDAYLELSFLGGFKNSIYEFQKDGKDYILRLTSSMHRNESQILSELEWVKYLYDMKIMVSRPIQSNGGKYTEVVEIDNIKMTSSIFVKAEGVQLKYPEYLGNLELFNKLGQMTGKIHKSSKEYIPLTERRFENFDSYYLEYLKAQITSESSYVEKALELVGKETAELERDTESYGLIHGDINIGNLCANHDEITIFDFDECHYSWYVEDIAIQLYYTIYVMLDDGQQEREEMSDLFMKAFMTGYLKENHLETKWIKQIPIFLRLREIIVHIGLYHSWDLANLNQWRKDYFEQSSTRIRRNIPIVEFRTEWII